MVRIKKNYIFASVNNTNANNRTKNFKVMKSILLVIAITVFSQSLFAQAASKSTSNLLASDVIFKTQQYINPILSKSSQKSFKMETVAEILGDKWFNEFALSICYFKKRGLIKIEIAGNNEIGTSDILALKYGVRFASLPTYLKVTDKVTTSGNKITKKWKLFSYAEKVQKLSEQQ